MIYAQIKDGKVFNIIVLNDASLEATFTEGFDYLKRIDNLDPVPHMGYLYDSEEDTFSPPEE